MFVDAYHFCFFIRCGPINWSIISLVSIKNLESFAPIGVRGIGKAVIALAVLQHNRVKEQFDDVLSLTSSQGC